MLINNSTNNNSKKMMKKLTMITFNLMRIIMAKKIIIKK